LDEKKEKDKKKEVHEEEKDEGNSIDSRQE
jgi:hypothetical protein